MTKFLITSAIPYVNGVKHLGNLVGSLLPADVHARFRRQLGDEVLFICGTDEHGTPTELAAADAGLPIREFCDRQHARQADIYRRFGLPFDHFGRSSSPANHALTQHFYCQLDEAGLIEERDVQQVWSPGDRRFLPDRYIVGTCPHCGAQDARGDQCEACGTLRDPPDLIDPRSAISGDRSLELRLSRHLFLRQSELVGRLRAWIDTRDGWPPVSKPLSPRSNQQVPGHQETRRIVVRLPLDTFLRLARPADNGRRGRPTEQEGLRRVFGEQATMKAPVPTALVRQRKAKSAFLERVLLRVKALIDYDAMFIEVDRAENVRIAFGIARNSEHSMGVVELDAELQMLFDDILNGDGRFNDNTSRLGKLSQQRSCVTLDPILRKIGDKFRHQVVILSSAS
jgi:hypothetical protein